MSYTRIPIVSVAAVLWSAHLQTVEATQKGVEELKGAEKYQKSARPVKCMMFLMVRTCAVPRLDDLLLLLLLLLLLIERVSYAY